MVEVLLSGLGVRLWERGHKTVSELGFGRRG